MGVRFRVSSGSYKQTATNKAGSIANASHYHMAVRFGCMDAEEREIQAMQGLVPHGLVDGHVEGPTTTQTSSGLFESTLVMFAVRITAAVLCNSQF